MIIHLGYFIFLCVGWSFADSGLPWPFSSEEESIINSDGSGSGSGSELSSWNSNEGTTLAFDLNESSPGLPLDESNLFNPTNSLFENSDEDATPTNLILSDNTPSSSGLTDENQSFELADCSSSSSIDSSVNGKFRQVKRSDASSPSCGNPDQKYGGAGSISIPPALMQDNSDILESLERAWDKEGSRGESKHNSDCIQATLGTLPWGACSNPDSKYTRETHMLEPYDWLGGIKLWHLDYCTLRKSIYSRIQCRRRL